jgi:hypothetical protein
VPEAEELRPTTTEPSALTPPAPLKNEPPGRSPRGVMPAAAWQATVNGLHPVNNITVVHTVILKCDMSLLSRGLTFNS